MRIALTYNQRTEDTVEQSELYRPEEIELLRDGIASHDHEVTLVEMSGTAEDIVDRLLEARPDLIFNVAEGTEELGIAREAYFPSIFTQLGIPYTGGGPSLLQIGLDKRLTEKILDIRGITTPKGALITREEPELPENLPLPLFLKPNYEGSSKGITQESVVESYDDARELLDKMLEEYPKGVEVSQYIPGRELTVPFLEAWPGQLLEIVEHDFSALDSEYKIFDYKAKRDQSEKIKIICPAELDYNERQKVLELADRILDAVPCPDLGRVDIRLHEDGTPYFIEINPLPRLMPDGSLVIAAKEKGLSFEDIIGRIILSAARRYDIPLHPKLDGTFLNPQRRESCREMGITIGTVPTGRWNAITDVKDVHVGHVTLSMDHISDPDDPEEVTATRTGITAIVPKVEDPLNTHLVAGGFVLNGIGEMSGLIQAIEWGWMETPILLTNTMSLGLAHTGVIQHMVEQHPDLGRRIDVIIPLIGETNDSFLNDVRVMPSTADHAIQAIRNAKSGPVQQGSVGGGTGMITFDFAGGIGSSSRKLPQEYGGYTVGVLVQSNFGKMRHLTIEGAVVGRELDKEYPKDIRRTRIAGSIIVIVATDAPLLSSQLNRLSKRAALGLGRVGSYAATTSGEIVFAFSTGNATSREAKEHSHTLDLEFLTDPNVNHLYEAVIECTEEAVLNAIFYSPGQTGRMRRIAPAVPSDYIAQLLQKQVTCPVEKKGWHVRR